jgi:hypothetical protein
MKYTRTSGLTERLKTANGSYEFTLVAFYPFDHNLQKCGVKRVGDDREIETHWRGLRSD